MRSGVAQPPARSRAKVGPPSTRQRNAAHGVPALGSAAHQAAVGPRGGGGRGAHTCCKATTATDKCRSARPGADREGFCWVELLARGKGKRTSSSAPAGMLKTKSSSCCPCWLGTTLRFFGRGPTAACCCRQAGGFEEGRSSPVRAGRGVGGGARGGVGLSQQQPCPRRTVRRRGATSTTTMTCWRTQRRAARWRTVAAQRKTVKKNQKQIKKN